jgi:hypothetical protein
MGLDTADGKTRAILPGPASFVNPCISPDGETVFFTDGGSGAIYCVNWDGSNRREFTKGLVQSPWTHPDDGSQWLYFLGDGLVRALMDDASVRETVWRGPVDGARLVSVSADGTHMGGCFPTPVPGVAIMPNGPWRQYGNGCSPSIAPDNSYRFFHMGTEVGHGGVRVYDDGGKNPRAVWFRGGKGGMPGHEETRNTGYTSWEARWSTDMRFFVVIVVSPTDAPACDIYMGQFDEGFTKVVKWVRVTDAPPFDTKPYCWIDPGLGNYEGEAPFTIAVPGKLTPGGEWAWDYGDGAKKKAAQGKHTYTKAGGYRITATQGQKKLLGWANVRPQKAPAVTGALAVDETRVLVRFDERVQLRDAKATLGSGGAVRGLTLDPEEKDLLVELDKPVGAAGTMSLSGVFDKAQVPNAVAKAPIRITRASWPSSRSGLIYLFEGNRADNTIYDPVSGPVSAVLNARFDRHGAILCRGGKIELPSDGTSERLLRQFSYYQGNQWHQKTELFTLEMVVQTADLEQQGPFLSLNILSSLWVGQEKRKVVVRLGGPDPKEPVQQFDAGTLPDDKAHHLVIAYRPKRLVCYVDGRKTLDADPSPAQMKWHNALGLNIGGVWRGRLEGIAMYSRFVEEAEVARNFAAYSRKLAARKAIASVAVRAKLLAKSAVPSAAEVAPYTRALVVYEYQVEAVTRGTLKEKVVRVARWGLMDSQPTPAAHEAVGSSTSLVLESYTDHAELVSELLRDTLPENFDMELWVEVE